MNYRSTFHWTGRHFPVIRYSNTQKDARKRISDAIDGEPIARWTLEQCKDGEWAVIDEGEKGR